MAKLRRVAWLGLINLLVIVLLLALLEGAASLLFVTHELITTPGIPEDRHAEHDALLGWVNRPNVQLPDYYGDGAGVRINSQRFRATRDYPREIPPGKTRIICSGDSFTFGYGVADGQAWCELLTSLDPQLETVNMGLGGYGVDQAYLWYLRDGGTLEHDVVLFSFLTDDFNRMRSGRFMGYGKPLLVARNDSLFIANRPVPRTSWLARRRALHSETIARLNVVRLARRLLGLDRRPRPPAGHDDAELRNIVSLIFQDLKRVTGMRQSRLVLVYLPGMWDYTGDAATDEWREFVHREAARQGIVFLDLVEEQRRNVPPTEVERLYAPNLHFSPAGNRWAAEVLHRRLQPLLDRSSAGTPVMPGSGPSANGVGS